MGCYKKMKKSEKFPFKDLTLFFFHVFLCRTKCPTGDKYFFF